MIRQEMESQQTWQKVAGWVLIVLGGSVLIGITFMMLAAVFNYFVPDGGKAEWAWGANFFTLLGAMCFFFASYLMIPEQAGAGRTTDMPPGSVTAKPA